MVRGIVVFVGALLTVHPPQRSLSQFFLPNRVRYVIRDT